MAVLGVLRTIARTVYALAHPRGVVVPIADEYVSVSARVARGLPKDIDSPIFRPWLESANKASVLIDAGANIGVWSVMAARRMSEGGRVFAFEPNPSTFVTLRDMARVAHGPGTIQPVQAALGQRRGTAHIVFDGDSTLAHLGTAGIPVPLTTIDVFCESNQVAPSAIKIDVEGAELDVLRGARQVMATCRPTILLELHYRPEMGCTPEALLPLLKDLGYRAHAPHGGELVTPESMYRNPAMRLSPAAG